MKLPDSNRIIYDGEELKFYTADQMLQFRRDTLEEVAQLFEPAAVNSHLALAKMIRKLKEKL